MSLVTPRTLFLAMICLSLTACAADSERQWYKPGVNYTMAEFQRDEQACMKAKVLDDKCMKERGWVAISADKNTIPPMQGGLQSPKPGRYAPGSEPK